jgi:gliding motility-associated lipoprotein GldB
MYRYLIIIPISLFFFLFTSCTNNPLDIDISSIEVDITVNRFDKDLHNLNTDSLLQGITSIQEKSGKFLELYNHKIISIGGIENEGYEEYLTAFLTDFTILETYKETNRVFDNLDWLEKDLTQAFKHYKYYYPEKQVPTVYTFVSGFNQSIVTAEDFIGIGLDKFLGKKNDLYEALQTPIYIRYKMEPKNIVPASILGLATTEIQYNDSIDNLISNIIHQGKLMYFMDAMLPNIHDSIKIGYSTQQLEWCRIQEKNMWAYLIENKHLFSTELMVIKRYIEESPFTKSFSSESPGRTGIWIGWQIVRTYAENNPEISFQDLMNNNNYQQILNNSKYNP